LGLGSEVFGIYLQVLHDVGDCDIPVDRQSAPRFPCELQAVRLGQSQSVEHSLCEAQLLTDEKDIDLVASNEAPEAKESCFSWHPETNHIESPCVNI